MAGPARRAPSFLTSIVVLALALGGCASRRAGPAPTAAPAAGVQPGTPASGERNARTKDPSDLAATAPMPIDPAIRAGVLPNGLHYYVRHHGKPEGRASLRLVVNAGSVLEQDEQRGLAHFVEHMAFNGTRLFQKQALVDYLERVGMQFGSDANASTSFDETIYTFTVPTEPETLAKGLLILQQIASDVSFDADEVDRERKVVLEEWRLGLGAAMRVLEQVMPVLLRGSRYAERLPIGLPSVLKHATAADLRKFYQRWYRPDLMAVAAVGDFDAATLEAELRKTFGSIGKPPGAADRPTFTVPTHEDTRVAVAQDPELPSTTVGVLHTMPRRPDASEGDYRRHIVESLYHAMLNARLEEQTRSASPPYLFAASTTQSLVRPTEMFGQLAGVPPDGVARGLEALTREVLRVQRHGFTRGELERAKTEQLRRIQSLATEQPNLPAGSFADEMVRHFLTGEAMPGVAAELRLYERYLPTITAAEMNDVAKNWLGDEDRVILVEAPKGVPVPARPDLLGIFQQVDKSELPPYFDHAPAGPLVAQLPAPGKIVEEHRIDDLGITELRLSNGARVLLKPTDFKRDEVLLGAYSPGGTSLVPDREYLSAKFAASIVGASGLGRFDPTELRNALAGKIAEVSPSIEELSEGILGRASPKDLDTMMQLAYLTFTAPRRDEGVFASFRAQLAEQLAHRDVDPQALFSDRFNQVLFANHLRRRLLAPGDEKKISLDRAFEIYRARFSNAADFTFMLVGSFTVDAVRPLVTQYLTSLPSTPRKHERWRDVGAWPVAGVHKFGVRKGLEPKSTVAIAFTKKARWSRQDDYLMDALVAALDIRLREVVREELGGTYGIDAAGLLQRQPHEASRVDVRFGCAPQSVDALVAAVFHEIDAAKRGALGATYVDKVQAAGRRSFEQATRTNGFWLGALVEHARYGTDLHLALKQPELIDSLTPARLAAAARRYLDDGTYVLGVLRPENAAVFDHPAPARSAAP